MEPRDVAVVAGLVALVFDFVYRRRRSEGARASERATRPHSNVTRPSNSGEL
jgi:hypothetical protein